MINFLKIGLLAAVGTLGSLLTGCVAPAYPVVDRRPPVVVRPAPVIVTPRPYYRARPYYRPAPRPHYGPRHAHPGPRGRVIVVH